MKDTQVSGKTLFVEVSKTVFLEEISLHQGARACCSNLLKVWREKGRGRENLLSHLVLGSVLVFQSSWLWSMGNLGLTQAGPHYIHTHS